MLAVRKIPPSLPTTTVVLALPSKPGIATMACWSGCTPPVYPPMSMSVIPPSLLRIRSVPPTTRLFGLVGSTQIQLSYQPCPSRYWVPVLFSA